MCGRFTLAVSPQAVAEAIGLFDGLPAELPPRYNIAPTQMVLAVRHLESDAQPSYTSLRWGLIPSWAEDASIASRLINARSDGIEAKPSFRAAFKRRRCLIVTDGFYEWRAGKSKKSPKQPFHIHRPDRKPFAFAGLWEHWEKGEAPLDTCTIITTSANDLMKPLHDRMPVILDRADWPRWLSPQGQDPARVLEMLQPCPADWLVAEPVSTFVNNPRHEGVECLRAPSLDDIAGVN